MTLLLLGTATVSRAGSPSYTDYTFSTAAGILGLKGFQDETATNAYDALFYYPGGVAIATNGNIFVADTFNDAIRLLTPSGTNYVVTTIATNFNYPMGVAVDLAGNVYVADTLNNALRKLTLATNTWVKTTLPGTYSMPLSVAVDNVSNVYVCNYNNTIQKLTPSGSLTTIAGASAQFNYPAGIALDGATNLYVADAHNDTIRKITPQGVITTVAGFTGKAGSQDGVGTNAYFNQPFGVAVDAATNIYVADYQNHTIRKISPTASVTTLGGVPGQTGSANGSGIAATFHYPEAIAVDARGRLFIADAQNDAIREGVAVLASLILQNPGVTNGHFGFNINGPVNQNIVVQVSTNLQTWTALATNSLTTSPSSFTDANSAAGKRFYRALIPSN